MTDEEAIKQLKSQLLGNKVLKLDQYDLQRLLDDVVEGAYELGARPKERGFPQEGDGYWFVDNDGDVLRRTWHSRDAFNKDRLRQGNVFPSEEAAQREARRREVRAKIAAIDADCTGLTGPVYFRKLAGAWRFDEQSVRPESIVGAVFVSTVEAAQRVLAEIPHEDLDLLCAEPEFVVPKEG